MKVTIRNKESFESLIKRFKNKIYKSKILEKIKRRRIFKKKSN